MGEQSKNAEASLYDAAQTVLGYIAWQESPEGTEYWREVHDKLTKRAQAAGARTSRVADLRAQIRGLVDTGHYTPAILKLEELRLL